LNCWLFLALLLPLLTAAVLLLLLLLPSLVASLQMLVLLPSATPAD
jgi:hypothetical protein